MSRRSVLRPALVGGLASIAGCTVLLDQGDGDGPSTTTAGNGGTETTESDTQGDSDTSTETESRLPGGTLPFGRWVPTRSRLGDVDELLFLYRDVNQIRANDADTLLVDLGASFFGLDPFAIDENMIVGGISETSQDPQFGPLYVHALFGDIDPDAVGTHLVDNGSSRGERYRDYQFYENAEEDALVTAVKESEVLLCSTDGGISETGSTFETFLDTNAGDGERFVEGNTHYRSIVEGFDDPQYSWIEMEVFPDSFLAATTDATAAGLGWTFLGSEVELVVRWVFESDADADVSAVRGWADDNDGLDTYDYDVTATTNVVELRGTTPTSQFDGLQPGTPGE